MIAPSKGSQQKRTRTLASVRMIIWTLLILFTIGGIVSYTLSIVNKRNLPQNDKSSRRRLITEVAPNKSRDVAETNSLKGDDAIRASAIEMPMLSNSNHLRLGEGARVITNAALRARGEPKKFKYKSERAIHMLLTTEFGTPVIGSPHYRSNKFRADLEAALNEPIQYDKDDDEETQKEKMAVQSAKDYLKEQMNNGEDICKVLEDTYNELQDLGVYYMMIKREFKTARLQPGATEQDVDDFVAAANILLEEKGVAPISLSESAREMIRLRTVELDENSEWQ